MSCGGGKNGGKEYTWDGNVCEGNEKKEETSLVSKIEKMRRVWTQHER